jgi:hypothetical protein
MATNKPMFDVLQCIGAIDPSILATSTRKIQQCKMLFDRCAHCAEGTVHTQQQRTLLQCEMLFSGVEQCWIHQPRTGASPYAHT